MNKVTVTAQTEEEAVRICKDVHGWTPDAVRAVDSGDAGTTAYMCFESALDANLWDDQT